MRGKATFIERRELLQREGRSTVREGRVLLEGKGTIRGKCTARKDRALLEREGHYCIRERKGNM